MKSNKAATIFTPKLSRILEESQSRGNDAETELKEDILKEYEIVSESDLLLALELDPSNFKKGEYLDGIKYKQNDAGSYDSDFDDSSDDNSTSGSHSNGHQTKGHFENLHRGAMAKNLAIMDKFRSIPVEYVKNTPVMNRANLDGVTMQEDGISMTSDTSSLSKVSKRRKISDHTNSLLSRNGEELLKQYLQNNKGYEFDSKEGRRIFVKSILKKYMSTYYVVSPPLVTSYDYEGSGVSTLLTIRNALKIKEKMVDQDGSESVVSSGAESFITSCVMFDCLSNEMDFVDFTCIARLNGLSVEAVVVSKDTDVKQFRKDVKLSCQSNERICVCSYSRHTLYQNSGSSFALIGGYFKEKDLVLLFDASRSKIPPYWIPLSVLFAAMDSGRNKNSQNAKRGYFLVEKAGNQPYILLNMNKNISTMLNSPDQHYEKLCDLKDSWENWLSSPQSKEVNILSNAVGNIMEIIQKVSFKQGSVNEEEAKLTYRQGSLVDSLTKTKIFSIIEQYVSSLSDDMLSKLTIFSEWVLETVFVIRKSEKTKNIFSATNKKKKKKIVKASVNMNTFNNTAMLTTWLLFWPYNFRSDRSNYSAMHEYIRTDLDMFPSHLVDSFNQQMSFVIKIVESSTLRTLKIKDMKVHLGL